jgi:hypothetical protein
MKVRLAFYNIFYKKIEILVHISEQSRILQGEIPDHSSMITDNKHILHFSLSHLIGPKQEIREQKN